MQPVAAEAPVAWNVNILVNVGRRRRKSRIVELN
jgi:hypothetical protein